MLPPFPVLVVLPIYPGALPRNPDVSSASQQSCLSQCSHPSKSHCSWCHWFPLALHTHSQSCIPEIPFPSSILPPRDPPLPVENHSGRTRFRMGFYQSFPEADPACASCCCPGASTWMAPECWDSGLSHYFPLLLIPSYFFPSFPFPSHPISHPMRVLARGKWEHVQDGRPHSRSCPATTITPLCRICTCSSSRMDPHPIPAGSQVVRSSLAPPRSRSKSGTRDWGGRICVSR